MTDLEVRAIAQRVMALYGSNKEPRLEDVMSAIRGPTEKQPLADDAAYDREFTAAISSVSRKG